MAAGEGVSSGPKTYSTAMLQPSMIGLDMSKLDTWGLKASNKPKADQLRGWLEGGKELSLEEFKQAAALLQEYRTFLEGKQEDQDTWEKYVEKTKDMPGRGATEIGSLSEFGLSGSMINPFLGG